MSVLTPDYLVVYNVQLVDPTKLIVNLIIKKQIQLRFIMCMFK